MGCAFQSNLAYLVVAFSGSILVTGQATAQVERGEGIASQESLTQYHLAATSCSISLSSGADVFTTYRYHSSPEVRPFFRPDNTEAARQRRWSEAVHEQLRERMKGDLGPFYEGFDLRHVECGGTVDAGQETIYSSREEAESGRRDLHAKLVSLTFNPPISDLKNLEVYRRFTVSNSASQHVMDEADISELYNEYLKRFAPKEEKIAEASGSEAGLSGAELAKAKLAAATAARDEKELSGAELARQKLAATSSRQEKVKSDGSQATATGAIYYSGNTVGVLDADGNVLIPFREWFVRSYSDGVAEVFRMMTYNELESEYPDEPCSVRKNRAFGDFEYYVGLEFFEVGKVDNSGDWIDAPKIVGRVFRSDGNIRLCERAAERENRRHQQLGKEIISAQEVSEMRTRLNTPGDYLEERK